MFLFSPFLTAGRQFIVSFLLSIFVVSLLNEMASLWPSNNSISATLPCECDGIVLTAASKKNLPAVATCKTSVEMRAKQIPSP
ncbi:hypothetical protein QBC38DRAFT_479669 [Podospora fimiseda]|uniref:Uncharacterized protein n=1 Tax=Podospora fimiseda TaxID=252190 RepID=A0AAN7BNZ7_9PEZI|nr:hypothetical protein QBC38DRAFT_479669 [Podospora fimiseda]